MGVRAFRVYWLLTIGCRCLWFALHLWVTPSFAANQLQRNCKPIARKLQTNCKPMSETFAYPAG